MRRGPMELGVHDLSLCDYQGALPRRHGWETKNGPHPGVPGAKLHVARGGDEGVYGAPDRRLAAPAGLPTAEEPYRPISP